MKAIKGLGILWHRLTEQGLWITMLWVIDHAVRILTGANLRSVSQITPCLHVGGQYRVLGWPRLAERGIGAVVNLRVEFDDAAVGIAPEQYLYLPTVDDHAPSLDQLNTGADFVARQVEEDRGVFIHCGAGVGRAPTMAAAYLVSTGVTPEQAWAQIRDARPFIRPTEVQIEQLDRFADSL